MEKTKTTILLDTGNLKLSLFLTFTTLVSGIIHVVNGQNNRILMGFGIAMIVFCVFYGVFAVLAYSKRSKYAPKVRWNPERIELKNSFWKKARWIKWSEIKRIHFASFKVEFELANGTQPFPYNTKAETSRELKRMLREFAESQRIEVIGG